MPKEVTEEQIKYIKDNFEKKLSKELNLLRVSGPMMCLRETGLNDDLGSSKDPISFSVDDIHNETVEIVQSLAKWKRMRLHNFDSEKYSGIYVDMNAIRPHETLDELHSLYVDQWDWEKIITEKDRNLDYLHKIVSGISEAIYNTAIGVGNNDIEKNVFFINSYDLHKINPRLTQKQSEYEITKKHKTVFIEQIGRKFKDQYSYDGYFCHDNRATDYDDWELNGDLLYWSYALQKPIEISSMGIRVNSESLKKQLNENKEQWKLSCEYPYHKMILNNELPLTIGGGIGQSRLCMLLLNKKHIGEVQSSVWPDNILNECKEKGIELL